MGFKGFSKSPEKGCLQGGGVSRRCLEEWPRCRPKGRLRGPEVSGPSRGLPRFSNSGVSDNPPLPARGPLEPQKGIPGQALQGPRRGVLVFKRSVRRRWGGPLRGS